MPEDTRAELDRLHVDVGAAIDRDANEGSGDGGFADLAQRVLEFQRRSIPAVAAFADGAAEPIDAGAWWRHAVPTGAFKRQRLFAGGDDTIERVFESSGTTAPGRRSRAAFSPAGLELMALAVEVNARQMLFPDRRSTRILVLAPPPTAAPAMIMAWGMARLIERFGADGSGFLIGPGGLSPDATGAQLERAVSDGVPVTLIGASFGLVHLLDALSAAAAELQLPPGSRVMHAGGFKGRSREVSAEALHGSVQSRLGVPKRACVNVLGMTELASQLYDDALAAAPPGLRALRPPRPGKQNPPWTQTVVLDPASLELAPPGETGVLVHLDLANVERPAVIRTQDLGRVVITEQGRGFEVHGRQRGSDARGCSLSVDDLAAGAPQ